ncbi:hypothetical protein ARAM_001094 [Aspergillus rambellii]|uniref:Protein-S-isoprenylcysteine O-methyltransferase n=1 Tax=Aspergillus rambellii TaxID=308745 RepID=A0A0F8VBS6_9EURO|nr:hypothetical protein ARAM_001094 [Aspergillus rambellii]
MQTALTDPDLSKSLSHVSFASAVFLGAYLIRRCMKDPNPPSKSSNTGHQKKDFLMVSGLWLSPAPYRGLFSIFSLAHGLFSLVPEAQRPALCPNYDPGVTDDLFHWNTYTAVFLLLLNLSGLLRVLAFWNLKTSFTFRLARPNHLITTGIHRYVRHPSYTALVLNITALLMLFFRHDGLIGCWVTSGIISRGIEVALLFWGAVITPIWFTVRVQEEETMLQETFGKEWEAYCARTKRFLPGVF